MSFSLGRSTIESMAAADNVQGFDVTSAGTQHALSSTLVPARVQKITIDKTRRDGGAPTGSDDDDSTVTFELFAGGRRTLAVRPGHLDVVGDHAQRDPSTVPPALQGLLRKELVPSILSAIEQDVVAGLIFLRFTRKDAAPRTLVLETDGRAPRWVLVDGTIDDPAARILAALPGTRPDDGRDTRRGRAYERPRRPPAPAKAVNATTTTTTTRVDPRLAQARQRLKSEHDRLKRLHKALKSDLDKHGDPASTELQGELLKIVMGTLKRGASSVVVTDYEDVVHTVVLDPAKDAKQNLTAIFARARRGRAARDHVGPRLDNNTARVAAVAALRARLASDDDTTTATLQEVEAFLRAPGAGASARRRAATSGTRQAWRSFQVSDDVIVRVGRGAKDNDALVKSAKGNDLWLHARDRTGAHAIIPSSGATVADDVLLDAAHLAAWFSQGRNERHVDIQHTRVKHLKKPGAGAPAGLFLVANETVVHLRVDDERVRRLLAAEIATS